MADPLTINVQQAPKAAPAVYSVPGAVVIEPLSAFATYDGAAAITDFLPALTFYSDAGLILARVFPGSVVAAGDSADVTFAPFLGDDGGVRFNAAQSYGTRNKGDFISIETTGLDPLNGGGITLRDSYPPGGGAIRLDAVAGSIYLLAGSLVEAGFIIGSAGVWLLDGLGGFQFTGPVVMQMASVSDTVVIKLFSTGSGEDLRVEDGNGAPIFEVRADGTIHGRAAVGAITWDL